MPKQTKKANLGRTLIKDRFSHRKNARESSMLHAAELNDGADWNRLNLRSVTEASNLEDFLATAELAGTEFKAARLNMAFVPPTSKLGMLSEEEKQSLAERHERLKTCLRIPRRPAWNKSMTAEELDMLERESFLEWRRRLADLESGPEGVILTPFEKNLEFWRQLWRVVERSDVVVQIVDARNPLLFRCEDLEHYVKEVGPEKDNVILVNKADFLTRKQRDMWAEYFSKQGVKAIFFSATKDVDEEGVVDSAVDSIMEEDEASGPEDDDVAALEAEKEAAPNAPKPGSLGLDAYYRQLEAGSKPAAAAGEPAEDEKLDDSDDETPDLVEAPVRAATKESSGHPEVDAMRIYGDPTVVTKTILDRAKKTREATGAPMADMKKSLLAPKKDLPVAITEERAKHGDGHEAEEEWEDMDSDDDYDEEDDVVDECVDEDGEFVLHEDDIAEIITLDDDDEPPPSSSDEDDAEDDVISINEEDILEIIPLEGGEPPSDSDDDDVDDDDDEDMEEMDEEEYNRRMKEETKEAVRREIQMMYEQRQQQAKRRIQTEPTRKVVKNSGRCLDREALIEYFKTVHVGRKHAAQSVDGRPAPVTIGLVGYPNVGKSSTINSLMMCKKVSVSTTPGKTKHFQTIFLTKDIVLCDCPGLVMPSFLSTKAQMVVSGILPIDQLRDHVPAINMVASVIPKRVLERTYGIRLPKPEETENPNRPPTSEELCNAYGFVRGFMAQRGLPDNPRTARYILKDFVTGKLLYCHSPPGCDEEAFEAETKRSYPYDKEDEDAQKQRDPTAMFKRMVKGSQGTGASVRDVDSAFFSSLSAGVHKKGPTLVKNSMESAIAEREAGGKPWKHHANKNKKEKLRRLFGHLDA